MSAPTEITPELLAGFLDEAPEYLEMLDAGLMEFESQAGTGVLSLSSDEDHERMNTMFRAAHSLKGLAAAFGFEQIKELTHRMETLFDRVRMGQQSLNGGSFEVLFRVFDRLKALIADLSGTSETPIDIEDLLAELDVELETGNAADTGNETPTTGTAEQTGEALAAGSDNEILGNPELLSLFIETTFEALDELNEGLLGLESHPGDAEQLNRVFRCAHNIKGASGAAGLTGMNRLTHELETAFDRLRSGTMTLSDALMEIVFRTVDRLRTAVEQVKAGNMQDIDTADLIAELEVCALADGKSSSVSDTAASVAADVAPVACASAEVTDQVESPNAGDPNTEPPESAYGGFDEETLTVAVTFPPDSADASIQAFVINNKLADIGTLVSTQPDLDALDLDEALLAVTFVVRAAVDPNELKTLVSAYGVSSVTVERAGDGASAESESVDPVIAEESASVVAAATPAQPTASAAVSSDRPPSVAVPQPASPTASKKSPAAPPKGSSPASPKTPDARPKPAPQKTTETLRVDQERLDQLMNLGGELVINRARFTQIGAQFRVLFNGKSLGYLVDDMNHGMNTLTQRVDELAKCSDDPHIAEGVHSQLRHLGHNLAAVRSLVERVHDLRPSMVDFDEALHGLTRVSDGIQKGIMGTRMVSVGPLFGRFRRVVRDICKASGKKVELVLRGEHTELDKRMIDELGDPLTHMVRNSVDHGVEMPEVRLANGKPEVGTVILEACHRGNSICIEVTDDGAGVNVERVKQKIIERELATPQQVEAMSEHDLVQFVFKPGFSTAAVVTDLSGRGMGMDIVVNKIDKLSGSVEIDSTEGQGAHVTIKLPLTLAILTSMVARIGEGVYAVPLEAVAEIITVKKSDVKFVQKRAVIQVRERIVPLAFFEDVFGTNLAALQTSTREDDELTLMIIGFEQQRIGLAVDELYGQEDVVIKSIADNYRNVKGIAGASIRGDGTVSLILDVSAMLEQSGRAPSEQSQTEEPALASA